MTGPSSLRAAVIGLGHLGRFHARVYSEIPGVDLRYLADVDRSRAEAAAGQYGGEPCGDYRAVLDKVDVVSVVTPTTSHHRIARDFLDAGVSVLVEKPMTATVEQADDLIRLAADHGTKLQVGHIERFNPAYRAVRDVLRDPVFIECHRLGPYPFRSTDVSVVLDLMIHDLDLILDLTGRPPGSVDAAGAAILSKGTDIANVRLSFETASGEPGCVANVTASRVSPTPMRRLRVFQSDAYISIDFLEKKVDVFRQKEGVDLARAAVEELGAAGTMPPGAALGELLDMRQIDPGPADALTDEITSFVTAVRDDAAPLVPGEDGRRALALAVAVEDDIQRFLAQRSH